MKICSTAGILRIVSESEVLVMFVKLDVEDNGRNNWE
jgi:hypothetical protein